MGDKTKALEKRNEYNRLGDYARKGINTHKPIMFDTTIDKFYSIVSWVSGTPVMDIIKKDVTKKLHSF